MKKLAIVIQRYGEKVCGGAEVHALKMAEYLTAYFEVTVLTSKATDNMTWEDVYENDIEVINGVTVRRFSVDKIRNSEDYIAALNKAQKYNASLEDQEAWMRENGPCVSGLIKYIKENKDYFDFFYFVTYVFYPTYFGIKEVGEKTIFNPCAHDEMTLYFDMFKNSFKNAKAIFYNSYEEKLLCNKIFDLKGKIDNDGRGGDAASIPQYYSAEDFKKRHGLKDFIVYIGRSDFHKGIKELFDYFIKYKKHRDNGLKLVCMGKGEIDFPQRDDIINLGFVSEEEKYSGLAASKLLVLPSKYESLSIVVLEAMAMKKPVIVNASCAATKAHCDKGNAGLYYDNYFEFEACMDYLLDHENVANQLGENGKKYTDENYSWEAIAKSFVELTEKM